MGDWRTDGLEAAHARLVRYGYDYEADRVLDALGDMLVVTSYYVPTSDELLRQYAALGGAYLNNRIKVRWVMCWEIREALWGKYQQVQYPVCRDSLRATWTEHSDPEELAFQVRTVMEHTRRWSDPGTLFGIPIRLDPAARTPMFEIMS